MRFFSVFGTLALAAFAYATPLANPEPVPAAANDVQVAARGGCSSCKSLPGIIVDVTLQVTPHVDYLKSLPAEQCTVETIKPVIVEIKGILQTAISDVEALVGSALDLVLHTVTGVLSLLNLCKLIATLYNLIFGCFGIVLKVVVSAEYDEVCALFAEVGVLLGTLLKLIIDLVGGVLAIVQGLLAALLPTITVIGCKDSFYYLY
ncbi:hypothetical protein VKT23_015738 [Stygiomarasmius scandens]|uniref:Uncharacterized protein n=1 Tax=Marasmiellus scandens TaxID=2682957 RepID=A0ABR1IX37_9AGAR